MVNSRFVAGLLGAALLALSACDPGMTADFTLKGLFAGKDVDYRVALTSGGGAVADGTNVGDNRHTADQLAMIGGQVAWTTLSGPCAAEPCPDNVELSLYVPPVILHADPWVFPSFSHLSLEKEFDPVLVEDLGGKVALEFEEPEFFTSGRVVLRQRAKFAPGPTSATYALEGTVGLEYQCHIQSQYFRHCGQSIGGDGQSNPLKLPYARNTCPATLVAPYEASPTWSGNTLQLGDLAIPCRETEGGKNGTGAAVLCYSKRTVEADGCTWRVHFLTDGLLYQFAVLGFADAACPKKTCNTYR